MGCPIPRLFSVSPTADSDCPRTESPDLPYCQSAILLGRSAVVPSSRRWLTFQSVVAPMVGTRGFEPPTLASRTPCATKLRHVPTDLRDSVLIRTYPVSYVFRSWPQTPQQEPEVRGQRTGPRGRPPTPAPEAGASEEFLCIPRVRVFRRQVPGTGYPVSGTGYLAPGTWYPAPEPVRRRGPNTEHRRPSPPTGKRAHRVCMRACLLATCRLPACPLLG